MSDDFSSFTTWGRKVQTSATVAGLLTRLLGQKIGLNTDHDAYAELLKHVLGNLRGPAMKIGQILATVPDMVPPEYVKEFLTLQSQAPPMNWGFVKRRMRNELGENWQEHFETFNRQASFAASLGQVHQATTKNGQQVACKLQYPQMEKVIESDLSQLSLLSKVYERFDKTLDTTHVQEEIGARLFEELDYVREAENARLFHTFFQDNDAINVPSPLTELCTQRLLTMTWCPGQSFLDAVSFEDAHRSQLGKLLFQAWYQPFYQAGLLHGDPHLGNYTFSQKSEKLTLFLLDFGCIRLFPAPFIGAVIDLYRGLLNQDEERMVHAYETWGFKPLTKDLLKVLNMWAHYLYAPLMDDHVRPIEESYSGLPGQEIAGQVHDELKKIGTIKIPREFVFMDRAAVGIGSALIHLRATCNWHQIFESMIQDFSTDKIAQTQKKLGVLDRL